MKRMYLEVLLGLLVPTFALAVPTQVPYSGQLSENGTMVNGTRYFSFTIYDALTGGAALYTQAESLAVTLGVYHTALNAPDSIWNGQERWLSVTVNSGTKLNPRTRIASVPYAVRANNASNADSAANAAHANVADALTNPPGWKKTIYSWNVFSTYQDGAGWLAGNEAALFGLVAPSQWTDGNATAAWIPGDKEYQRALFTQKGYCGKNALVYAEVRHQYSSTDGRVVACLFRVKNTTSNPITWTLFLKYTANSAWSEMASLALNGAGLWTSGGGSGTQSATVNLSIPANRTSTVIVVSTASAAWSIPGEPIYTRQVFLGFYNDCLQLPAGLQYVDDLDVASGGYEQ